jgi:dihydropteroate synthase
MRAEQRARRDSFLAKIGTRPIVMGILNLTPDSFSDGGRYVTIEAALSHARQMAAEGADIIDVGGESTRPGAAAVGEPEELARVEFILAELATKLDVPLSIDTYKSKVAACRRTRRYPHKRRLGLAEGSGNGGDGCRHGGRCRHYPQPH